MKKDAKITDSGEHKQEGSHLLKSRTRALEPLFYLCFALAVFLLYSNTFYSPFMFDDWAHIEANPHIQITSLSWDALVEAGFDSPLKNRPVSYITLALNYYFDGFALPGYHLVNILIHLVAGIFLYMLLRTTLSLQTYWHKSGDGPWLPFAAVLVWIVHPLHVQSVTYIIQRMNSLAAMFFILSLLLYVKGRLAERGPRQIFLFLGSVFAGVLSLGSKENAATLPFIILLYEWFFLQDLSFTWLRRKVLPILGVGIFLAVIALLFLGAHPIERILSAYGIRDFTPFQRVLTEFRIVVFYISLLILPNPARLNIEHDFPISLSLLNPPATFLSLAALLGIFALAVALSRRERILAFTILWFLGNLVIESSVIGLELIFEHRTYLPSMLAVLALVMVCDRVLTKKWLKVFVTILVVSLFSAWTYQRNLVWQDEVTLRRDAVAKSPAKPRAHAILANALERNHEYVESEKYYKITLSLQPRNADEIHYNLGNVLMAQGKLDEAVEHFREAVVLSPNVAVMRLNLAYALALRGSNREAVAELQELIRLHPEEPRAHNNLGTLLMKQGRFKEAMFHFREALRLMPSYERARMNLELALRSMQKQTWGQ